MDGVHGLQYIGAWGVKVENVLGIARAFWAASLQCYSAGEAPRVASLDLDPLALPLLEPAFVPYRPRRKTV